MTFPTYDPQFGLPLNEAGTDAVPIWPKQQSEWTAAVVKASLWQIKGQWKFDLNKGIDLQGLVLGQVPVSRVIQETFRREIAKNVDLTTIRLSLDEQSRPLLEWEGSATAEGGTIGLIEPPIIEEVAAVAAKLSGSLLSVRFTDQLFPYVLPSAESFETFGTSAEVESTSIQGNHLFIQLTEIPVEGSRVVYTPDANPLRGLSQVLATPFGVTFGESSGPDYILTESQYIQVDSGYIQVSSATTP